MGGGVAGRPACAIGRCICARLYGGGVLQACVMRGGHRGRDRCTCCRYVPGAPAGSHLCRVPLRVWANTDGAWTPLGLHCVLLMSQDLCLRS